jgi:hypothetical protein
MELAGMSAGFALVVLGLFAFALLLLLANALILKQQLVDFSPQLHMIPGN